MEKIKNCSDSQSPCSSLQGKNLGNFNFDELINRRNSGCVKWDEAPDDDIIPMWVADMDFHAAPAIQQALQHRVDHGVFGYTMVTDEYYQAIINWFSRRHNWITIERSHILYTTGVIPAIACALKAITMPGENVVIMTPVYNCFFSSIRNCGCQILESPLLPSTDKLVRYSIDWDDLKQKLAQEKTTALLLCNPHNPVGRIWTNLELQYISSLCKQYHVAIISDEIHCELTMPGQTFVPMGTIDDEAIILNSPSKAFNIAGLQTANIICRNPQLRRKIDRAININEVCDLNPFGPVALIAAYNESEAWLDKLKEYLWENYQYLISLFAKELPNISITQVEATYLAWIDITSTGLDADTLTEKLLNEGRVMVSSGSIYGDNHHLRINMACPRQRLIEGLQRIINTLKSLNS